MGLLIVVAVDLAICIGIIFYTKLKVVKNRKRGYLSNKSSIVIFSVVALLTIPLSFALSLLGVYGVFKIDQSAYFGPGATVLMVPVILNVLCVVFGMFGLMKSLSKTTKNKMLN
jgi:hypothetical protein